MRVAILSCGPSLSTYPGPDSYGIVIAVNRAILGHAAQWWSVGDDLTFGRYYPRLCCAPLVWTHTETYRIIIGRFGWIDGAKYKRDERDARWSMFSATAALWLAHILGADECDCFGCDMAGELNWDGTPEPEARRTEQRWELERGIWQQTVERLAPTMKVIRHGPDEPTNS